MAKSYRVKKPELVTQVYGKVPPQSIELEKAVLGACMLEMEAFEKVRQIIFSSECFYSDAHQKIYAAIMDLSQLRKNIDELTVIEQLKKADHIEIIGGTEYISELTFNITSTAHCEIHSAIIMEKYMKRELIRIGQSIINDAYDEGTDVFDLQERGESEIKQITAHIVSGDNISVFNSAQKVIANYELQKQRKTSLTGISTGFYDLDNLIGGWTAPSLILIGGFPSMGKTALMLNILYTAAKDKKPTKIFSLETGDVNLTTRLCASINKIPLGGIKRGTLNPAQEDVLIKSAFHFYELKIDISKNIFFIEDLETEARKSKKRHPDLALIGIDFIQLVKRKSKDKMSRNEEVAYISRRIKLLSAELQIPIIALSQMKEAEAGIKKYKPTLGSYADSRELGWNADIAIVINYEDGQPVLVVLKNKDGECDTIKVKFNADIQLWSDFNDMNQNVLPGFFKTNQNSYSVSSQDNKFKKEDWNEPNF